MISRARVMTKGFRTRAGGEERMIVVRPTVEGGFIDQYAALTDAYDAVLEDTGLPVESAVFRRIFLSDAQNQAPLLGDGALLGSEIDPVAVSLVEQPPAFGAKIALLAYHVTDPVGLSKRRIDPHHLLVAKNGNRHLWGTGLGIGRTEPPISADADTRAVFEKFMAVLGATGSSLAGHCVRTWLFVKGIDVFYPALVASRARLFAEQGLSAATHAIAATCIEGASAHRFDVVAMDAYAQLDLRPDQLTYLNDFAALCAPQRYGVAFERATSVSYRDRSQIYLSGTASIDREGRVVHQGDVLRQLGRALDNAAALMRAGAADLTDLLYLIVYLRDRSDARPIEAALAARLPGLPVVLVAGAVCRPEWLVEIEGVGVAPAIAAAAAFPCF